MRHFDGDYVREVLERLERIPADAVPRWGRMRKEALIRHLVWALRHSMGRSTAAPAMSNWVTRKVVGPLFLRGLLPMPRNVQLPRRYREQGVVLEEPGDLETLHALLEEYVALVQADELTPAPHPLFGDIGIDGWDRLHVRHFEHHLRQFGV